MNIDITILEKQIKDVLESNIPEGSKEGLHNLLGTILDDANTFPITSVCREDIIHAFKDVDELTPEISTKILNFSNDEMKWIARKLADNFCNCCFWDSLKDLSERVINNE